MGQQLIAKTAVGYMRTSSQINAGDKGSKARQRAAIKAYAKANGLEIVGWFYDEGVSGTVPVRNRPAFEAMMTKLLSNGCSTILIESLSRFAREIEAQVQGYRLVKSLDLTLIPVDKPDLFTDDDPQGIHKFYRTMETALDEQEKDRIVYRLRAGRDRKSKDLKRRCEGRKPVPPEVIKQARRLNRKSPKTHQRRSLREIAKELGKLGYLGPSGDDYHAGSIKAMLERK